MWFSSPFTGKRLKVLLICAKHRTSCLLRHNHVDNPRRLNIPFNVYSPSLLDRHNEVSAPNFCCLKDARKSHMIESLENMSENGNSRKTLNGVKWFTQISNMFAPQHSQKRHALELHQQSPPQRTQTHKTEKKRRKQICTSVNADRINFYEAVVQDKVRFPINLYAS